MWGVSTHHLGKERAAWPPLGGSELRSWSDFHFSGRWWGPFWGSCEQSQERVLGNRAPQPGSWQDCSVWSRQWTCSRRAGRLSGLLCMPYSWAHCGPLPALRDNWELLWVTCMSSWESGPSSPRRSVLGLGRWPDGKEDLVLSLSLQ